MNYFEEAKKIVRDNEKIFKLENEYDTRKQCNIKKN